MERVVQPKESTTSGSPSVEEDLLQHAPTSRFSISSEERKPHGVVAANIEGLHLHQRSLTRKINQGRQHALTNTATNLHRGIQSGEDKTLVEGAIIHQVLTIDEVAASRTFHPQGARRQDPVGPSTRVSKVKLKTVNASSVEVLKKGQSPLASVVFLHFVED